MAKTTKAEQTKRTFIPELKNGNVRRITIPSNWKLTYGSVVPYESRGENHTTSDYALRLYEGSKENLRAVMTDVVSIRDASFEVMEKHTAVEARVTEWVNPDKEEGEEFPQ